VPTTALVLAGGGARGAYEAGALTVILPELDRRGERPTVHAGVGALRDPDFLPLNELLGGVSTNHWEVLSLLFFDEEFIDELLQMGRRDAQARLDTEHDREGPWQIGPLGLFTRPRQWTAG
jgi:hypothetical protein